MAYKIKEYSHNLGEDEILVRDHIGIFSGKEEVLLNGEQIALHESRMFKREKYDYVLINRKVIGKSGSEFHLRVVCGMHLNIFARTHVFVNGELVGGDIGKPIYIPPCPWFCLMFALSLIGLADIVFDGGPMIYNSYSEKRDIRSKVEQSSAELWQKDIGRLFYKKNVSLKDKKKSEWQEKCEKYKDHHCRLASYIYSIDGDEVNRVKYSLVSCLNDKPLSCYQTYLARTFTVNHPNYKEVTKNLISLCSKSGKFNDREKVVCRGFSRDYFKESGDKVKFEEISKKLCDEGDEFGCYNLQAIKGEIIKYK